ncbi:MAG: radical SAM family heme chaperone HemW, partial [Phycisphaerae bacterium]|nr:radical SAM family heme chaperone HemW [Phycisphaerae bacterium]
MISTGLYIHVPFCSGKCWYCDFYSICGSAYEMDTFLRAIKEEIQLIRRQVLNHEEICLETIFIGGGTPTSLEPDQIRRLGEIIDENFQKTPDCEFSIEANPESLSPVKMSTIREIGVNRLSIGTQTFNPGLLKAIGRRHTGEQTIRAMDLARSTGIKNISLDLIFGLPDQTLDQFQMDLTTAATLGPEHLSCYALTLEPGTKLYETMHPRTDADEILLVRMFHLAHDFLTAIGFEHYEISNYALPGRRCRHNFRYWQNLDYMGLGPAAAGFLNRSRYKNVSDFSEYWKSLLTQDRRPIESEEHLADHEFAGETAMLNLRTHEGIVRSKFQAQTGYDPFEFFAEPIRKFVDLGLLEIQEDRIFLSLRG